MATFHHHLSTFSRGRGQSSVAAASYRSGEKLHCAREGQTKYPHRAKADVLHSQMFGWVGSREALWSGAEVAEVRGNACVAREIQIALPDELPHLERVFVAQDYASWLCSTYGVAVDLSVHKARKGKGANRNHHAHLQFTTRKVQNGLFGEKLRILDERATGSLEITRMRQQWKLLLNAALQKAKLTVRVSSKRTSNPKPKLTPSQAAMLRRRQPEQAVSQSLEQMMGSTSREQVVVAEPEIEPPAKSMEEAVNTPIAGKSRLEQPNIEQNRPNGNVQQFAEESIRSEELTQSTDASDATTTPPAPTSDTPETISSQPEHPEQVDTTAEEPLLSPSAKPAEDTAQSHAPAPSTSGLDDHQITKISQLQRPKAAYAPRQPPSPSQGGMTPEQIRACAEEMSKLTGETIEEILEGLNSPLEDWMDADTATESKPAGITKTPQAPNAPVTHLDDQSPRTISQLKRPKGSQAPLKPSFQQAGGEESDEPNDEILERMATPQADNEAAVKQHSPPTPSRPKTTSMAASKRTVKPSTCDEDLKSDAFGGKT